MGPNNADPNAVGRFIRSKRFFALLVIAGVLGGVISVFAFGFLQLTSSIQGWMYTSLPHGVGFGTPPAWWPLIPLALAGLVVGATIRYLPGRGGHVPLDGI